MRKPYRSYLTWLLFPLGLISLLVTGVLYWADPYGLYHPRDLVGLEGHDRLVKPHWLADATPSILLGGSSRAQLMLDPEIVTNLTGKPAFNASLSGANLYEVRRMVEHAFGLADQERPIEKIIIGLDFYMFNENRSEVAGFNEARLALNSDGTANPLHPYADLSATLLSRDALDELRRRVKYQDRPCQAVWNPNGGRIPHDYDCSLVRDRGQQESVSGTLREYIERKGLYVDYKLAEIGDTGHTGGAFGELSRLLGMADENVELILFIAPVHALHHQMIELMGLTPSFTAWKAELVSMVDAAQQRGAKVHLWDMARVSPWTDEPVFSVDRGEAANFYDSHHLHWRHRQHFLEILFGKREPEEGEAIQLTAANLPASVKALSAALRAWGETHPEDMNELRTLHSESVQ